MKQKPISITATGGVGKKSTFEVTGAESPGRFSDLGCILMIIVVALGIIGGLLNLLEYLR